MSYRRSIIKEGAIVRHFKHDPVRDYESMKYLYKVLAVALDTETNEKVVVYQALYKTNGKYQVFTRNLQEFMSEVDHVKYPDVKQKYRFEVYR